MAFIFQNVPNQGTATRWSDINTLITNMNTVYSDIEALSASSLANGSFEIISNNLPVSWTPSIPAGKSINMVDTVSGTNNGTWAVNMSSTSNITGAVTLTTTNAFTVSGGEAIAVEFWILCDIANISNSVAINYYDEGQNYISTQTLYNNSTTNPLTWTRYYYYSTPPANGRYATIIITGLNSAVNGNVWWDGFAILPAILRQNWVYSGSTLASGTTSQTLIYSPNGVLVASGVTICSGSSMSQFLNNGFITSGGIGFPSGTSIPTNYFLPAPSNTSSGVFINNGANVWGQYYTPNPGVQKVIARLWAGGGGGGGGFYTAGGTAGGAGGDSYFISDSFRARGGQGGGTEGVAPGAGYTAIAGYPLYSFGSNAGVQGGLGGGNGAGGAGGASLNTPSGVVAGGAGGSSGGAGGNTGGGNGGNGSANCGNGGGGGGVGGIDEGGSGGASGEYAQYNFSVNPSGTYLVMVGYGGTAGSQSGGNGNGGAGGSGLVIVDETV